tara:strand:- start:2596 stop:2811 length:216 start_codon:yes stop_codon:yes gene_type:complete
MLLGARVTRRDTNKDKRGGGEKKERKIFHSKSHTKFLLLRIFTRLNFTTISSSYIYLYYNKEEKKKFSFQG